ALKFTSFRLESFLRPLSLGRFLLPPRGLLFCSELRALVPPEECRTYEQCRENYAKKQQVTKKASSHKARYLIVGCIDDDNPGDVFKLHGGEGGNLLRITLYAVISDTLLFPKNFVNVIKRKVTRTARRFSSVNVAKDHIRMMCLE